jgi:hypothetical protein
MLLPPNSEGRTGNKKCKKARLLHSMNPKLQTPDSKRLHLLLHQITLQLQAKLNVFVPGLAKGEAEAIQRLAAIQHRYRLIFFALSVTLFYFFDARQIF